MMFARPGQSVSYTHADARARLAPDFLPVAAAGGCLVRPTSRVEAKLLTQVAASG